MFDRLALFGNGVACCETNPDEASLSTNHPAHAATIMILRFNFEFPTGVAMARYKLDLLCIIQHHTSLAIPLQVSQSLNYAAF